MILTYPISDMLTLADRALGGAYVSDPTTANDYMLAENLDCDFFIISGIKFPGRANIYF
jgi:hypothetical protein